MRKIMKRGFCLFLVAVLLAGLVPCAFADEAMSTEEVEASEAATEETTASPETAVPSESTEPPSETTEPPEATETTGSETEVTEPEAGPVEDAPEDAVEDDRLPRLGVSLPIYHGTEEETLDRGVGHLIGSSLPIGGSSTHAILTGHSGLASQKMFSDLDKLEMGDTFYLEVLNEVLAYEVDQINTVLPHDTTYLGLEKGKDLCTLVTCTPFGVNTHRLLVRGHRIPYTPENTENPAIELAETEESVDSTWEQEYEKGVYLAISIVVLICLILFIVWLTQKGESNAA